MVSDIMSQDKKSKKDNIEKLREILDKPYDPKIKKSISKDDKHLDSIRRRLLGESPRTEAPYTPSDFSFKGTSSLEPRVTIHKKEEEITRPLMEQLEPAEQKEEIKEDFTLPEEKTEEDLFDDVDLYEIEKVEVSETEFLEVKPKEIPKKREEILKETEEILPIPKHEEKETTKETKEIDENLPEWEPVEETKPEETEDKKEGKTAEELHEFEKIDEEKELPAPIPSEPQTEAEAAEKKEETTLETIPEFEKIDEKKEIKTETQVEPQTPIEEAESEEELPTFEPVEDEEIEEPKIDLTTEPKEAGKIEEPKIDLQPIPEEVEEPKIELQPEIEEEKQEIMPEEKKEILEEHIEEEVQIPSDQKEEAILEEHEEKLSKEKEREAKRIEKEKAKEFKIEQKEKAKKEKEEKKIQKLEAKKALKEAKEKEIDAKRIEKEKPKELARREKKPEKKEKGERKFKKAGLISKKLSTKQKEDHGLRFEKKIVEEDAQLIDAKLEDLKMEGKLDAFNDIKNIDEKTAWLLYKSGYTSVDKLREATVSDITKIKGIKRNVAKNIKMEIGSGEIEKETVTLPVIKEKPTAKETISEDEELSEWESYTIEDESELKPDVYTHGDYTLYKKELKTATGKKRTVHFFSKEKPDVGEDVELPEGYDVKVNKRTGLPYLKKKK